MSTAEDIMTDIDAGGGQSSSVTTDRPSKVAKHAPDESPSSQASKEVIDIENEEESNNNAVSSQAPSKTVISAPVAPSTTASSTGAYHIKTLPNLTSSSYDYVEDQGGLSQHLVCPICMKPLVKPVQHKCGSLFCASCIQKEGAQCGECQAPMRPKELVNPAKPIIALLDSLIVRCACSEKMPRSQYEVHWLDGCTQKCPFADSGCLETCPRSALNAHIDSCKFAPVACDAATYGCTWTGQREAFEEHSASCRLKAALPVFAALEAKHAAELRSRDIEIAALREAVATREAQLRSYRDKEVGSTASPATPTTWKVGTLIDALDTESSWLVAKIIKVDVQKRQYGIHYVDWDVSWNEMIPFGSPRLAAAGTHTGTEHVEKHVRKVIAAGVGPNAHPTAPATPDVFYSNSQPTTPATGKNKRKA